jgi:hypothetical protein
VRDSFVVRSARVAPRSVILTAIVATACGRVGYDQLDRAAKRDGGDHQSSADASLDGRSTGAAGGQASAAGGRSGAAATATDAASGGAIITDTGGVMGAGAATTGGGGNASGTGGSNGAGADAGYTDAGAGAGGGTGTGGQAGAGGAYTCTSGATEICDGRDNNCDGQVDEGGACPNRCTGHEWGGHGYMFCDQANTPVDGSETLCEAQGMKLAKIDSQAENDFLTTTASSINRTGLWVGGSESATPGQWRWPDGTEFWSGGPSPSGFAVGGAYTNWDATQPDGLTAGGKVGASCLVLLPQSTWSDDGCNFFRPSACETP